MSDTRSPGSSPAACSRPATAAAARCSADHDTSTWSSLMPTLSGTRAAVAARLAARLVISAPLQRVVSGPLSLLGRPVNTPAPAWDRAGVVTGVAVGGRWQDD